MSAPQIIKADPKHIIDRYLSDSTTLEIAAELGVTRQALYQYMAKHSHDEWKEAQVARAIARKESAEDALDDATKTPDMLSVSRARERLRAAQWDLERICRRIYGQDVPASVAAVQISINLRRENATDRTAQEPIEAIASLEPTQATD